MDAAQLTDLLRQCCEDNDAFVTEHAAELLAMAAEACIYDNSGLTDSTDRLPEE